MAEFPTISGKDPNYPQTPSSDPRNNSAGFVTPYKLGTGVMRGTQTIINSDGSKITLGNIPGSTTDFGIGFIDESGNIIKTDNGDTQFIYDPTTGKNIIQMGKLPDGTYGLAIAKAGYNVSDAITP